MSQILTDEMLVALVKVKAFDVSFDEYDTACIKAQDALEIMISLRDQYEERLQTVVSSVRTNTFQIESDYYEGGVVFDVETGKCIEAAPILGWMVGQSFEQVKAYVKKKSLKMRKV